MFIVISAELPSQCIGNQGRLRSGREWRKGSFEGSFEFYRRVLNWKILKVDLLIKALKHLF